MSFYDVPFFSSVSLPIAFWLFGIVGTPTVIVLSRIFLRLVGAAGLGGLCLLEAGFAVDIFSRDNFWKTTSTSAGAYWWPHRAYPEERISQWSKETFNVFKVDKDNSNTGVSFEKHIRLCLDPDDSAYARHLSGMGLCE